MSRRNGRAQRGDRRRSPPVATPTTNGNFRPRNPPHLRIAGGFPPHADFFPRAVSSIRTRNEPARRFEHPRGPCLTCGWNSDGKEPLEDDAFVRPRPRASRLREDRRKGAIAGPPRVPRCSPARHISPQRVSQKGRMTPLMHPNVAKVATVPPLPESPSFAAETYAQVTDQGNTGDTKPAMSANPPPRHPYIRPVDPVKEGRCLRCLARGNMARDCRELLKCRLCRHGGHRQANCPLRRRQEVDPASKGLYACLVGECSRADVAWTQISAGLQGICPELANSEYHWLATGEIFLPGLSKTSWRRLHGRSIRLSEGGIISWRRPRPTDGALAPQKEIRRIEVRGVPFGLRQWHQLQQIIRPAGVLREIVCNGLNFGDPNCLCLDVEMETVLEVPRSLRVKEGAGAGMVIMLATLPPPHPLNLPPLCPQVASCPEQAAQPASSRADDEEDHQMLLTREPPHIQQHPPLRDLSDPQNPPAIINVETEAHEHITNIPASTPDTVSTLRAEGPLDSLLLYRSRRRLQTSSGSTRGDGYPHHEEGREEAGHEVTQASLNPSPEESFVPESVRLFSPTEVVQDMGLGNGVLPSPP